LAKKEKMAFVLLSVGTILYSIIGGFYFDDFLWVIHQNPYKGAEEIYGRGPLTHFIDKNEFIWGWALTVLLVISLPIYAFEKKLKNKITAVEWLMMSMFLLFLIMHSVFWWKGLFGSLGLIRVMACTIPLAAIMALRGFELIRRFIANRKIQYSLAAIIVGVQIYVLQAHNTMPFPATFHDRILKQTADYLKQNKLNEHRIHCSYPYLAVYVNADFRNDKEWGTMYSLNFPYEHGDIIVWDTHFAQFDNGVPLDSIMNDPRMEQLILIGDVVEKTEERGYKFGCRVFRVK
jgi:hypothetical protein